MFETTKKTNNLTVISHPVIMQNLAIMRNKNTPPSDFRTATKRICEILLYEVTKNLPTTETTIQTPLEIFSTKIINPDIKLVISPILRAGLIFTQAATEILPQAHIWHIGMYRDEKTLSPVWYYNKMPEKIENPQETYVYITDPMLATGNSLLETVKLYVDKGIPQKQIKAVCIISAPEGVEKIHSHFPDIEIFTAALDRTLNEKGYILPGLGDAGDRLFNTL